MDPAIFSLPDIGYLQEPRGRYTGTSPLLARPRDLFEVVTLVKLANEMDVGIVPYAGGTGLVGGQVMVDGPAAMLLSVERMNRIRDVDARDNVLVCEAGVILADVQAAAAAADRLFPLSLAAEGSARIGGNLATNAGGVQVLRYGNARDLCLGVEAVLPDGTVFNGLKRLRKDNTGYDLRHLLIGSEGTLGIITAASLKMFPAARERATALVVVEDPDAALTLLNIMRDHVDDTITAFELMSAEGYRFLAEKVPDAPQPFAEIPAWSVLVELGSGHGGRLEERLMAALEAAMSKGVIDALIAQSEGQRQDFWAVRERIPEANRLIGAISSHDISVPVSKVPEFIKRTGPLLMAMGADIRINCFGHLGDGNLHYNVFPAKGGDRSEYEGRYKAIKDCVHEVTDALGGSVSAEHGIGRLKTGDLERFGDPGKLLAMRAIKRALDPKGLFNPGAVLRV
nr:FAD-binding oxidoreductase [Algicella marina]